LVVLTALLLPGRGGRGDILPPVWRWSNPVPHGADVFGLARASDGSYVEAGEQGQIFTSDDLATWIPQPSPSTLSLRAATFLGGRLVMVGASGAVVVSDTLATYTTLSLNTTNWLEGVAASSNLVVAVGDNGSVYTSTNGLTWQHVAVSFSSWLNGVCYGGNNLFVAVGESGFIATSANGQSWTQVSSHTTDNLNGVGWMGNEFIAVGDSGVTLASASGSSWSSSSTGVTNSLYSAAGTTNLHLSVGDLAVHLQTNSTWLDQTATNLAYAAPQWSYYASAWATNSTNAFVVAGYSGGLTIGATTNSPLAWRSPTTVIRSWIWQTARGVDHYVAVGNYGTVMSSPDGYAWTVELVPPSLTNSVLLGVTTATNYPGYTNVFLAVGTKGSLVWATNVFLWGLLSPPTTNDLAGVLFDGSQFLACGDNGTLLTTADLKTWTQRATGTTSFLASLALAPGKLVAVGANGTILTSADRATWTRTQVGTNWLSQVAYLNGALVVVGNNGTILTSYDATNWVARASGVTNWLNAVDYVGSTWFVAGNEGTVLGSPDLTNWVSFASPTTKSLYSLSHSGGQLLAAGAEGVVLRSLVVPPATPVNIVSYAVQTNVEAFLFTGQLDQQFYLYWSTNLTSSTNWVQGPLLDFNDDSGTLLYVAPAPTNSRPRTFFRTSAVQ